MSVEDEMPKLLLFLVVSLLGVSAAACAAEQEGPKPFETGEDSDADDDDDDAPSRTTDEPRTGQTGRNPTTTIDTRSCGGVSLTGVTFTSVAAGSLPAATGGTITNGTWVLTSAEAENASSDQLTMPRQGMIRFDGNRFAWKDGEFCAFGTFTTSGASFNGVTDEEQPFTVTYTAEGTAFTLKRGPDEAYHYEKQ